MKLISNAEIQYNLRDTHNDLTTHCTPAVPVLLGLYYSHQSAGNLKFRQMPIGHNLLSKSLNSGRICITTYLQLE